MAIKLVVFDVGGTLIDESRMWQRHADNLGVSAADLLKVLEATIARREHHHRAFAHFDPTYAPGDGRLPGAAYRSATTFDAGDLFPDVLQCIRDLRALGVQIGVAGNQPTHAAASLAASGLQVDLNVTSAHLGVAKPDLAFFEHIIEISGHPAKHIAYVGDRLDNDVLPASAVGMMSVFLIRGLWGHVHATWPEVSRADATINDLSQLPTVLNSA